MIRCESYKECNQSDCSHWNYHLVDAINFDFFHGGGFEEFYYLHCLYLNKRVKCKPVEPPEGKKLFLVYVKEFFGKGYEIEASSPEEAVEILEKKLRDPELSKELKSRNFEILGCSGPEDWKVEELAY